MALLPRQPRLRQHHQHHAAERQPQPQQLAGGQPFPQKQRPQPHQHKRLGVVHRGGDGDRRIGIGGEQQQPVDHQRDAAGDRQQQRGARQRIASQLTQYAAHRQQHQRAYRAAPKHHVDNRLAGHQHKPADRAGNQHRRRHLQRSAFYLCIHSAFLEACPET